MVKPAFVTEQFAASKPSGTVDRAKGVVYGVRVVGPASDNRRKYPTPVQARSLHFYEGIAVNWGHARLTNGRPAQVATGDRFGRLKNARIEGDGTHADLFFNPHHPSAEAFCWACENDPGMYALSHIARVQWAARKHADGSLVAESILEVASVDIVADGGTNTTIFESANVETDIPTIAATLTTPEMLGTFLTDLMAALKLGDADKLAAVEDLLEALEPDEPADDAAKAAAVESLRRRGGAGKWAAESLDAARADSALAAREAWVREQCAAAGLKPENLSEVFVSTVMESADDRAAALIAERKGLFGRTGTPAPAKTPRTSAPGSPAKSISDLVKEADFGE